MRLFTNRSQMKSKWQGQKRDQEVIAECEGLNGGEVSFDGWRLTFDGWRLIFWSFDGWRLTQLRLSNVSLMFLPHFWRPL